MAKTAVSVPAGNGGTSGWPFTKWASGTRRRSDRPGRACWRVTISVLCLGKIMIGSLRPVANVDRGHRQMAGDERWQQVAQARRHHGLVRAQQLFDRPPVTAGEGDGFQRLESG